MRHREDYKDRIDRDIYQRKWRVSNPESANATWQKYRIKNKAKRATYNKSWTIANREKVRAHKAVRRAILRGRLIKPTQCSRCGKEKFLHGHHDDYSKPLSVEWVCSSCHRLIHQGNMSFVGRINRPRGRYCKKCGVLETRRIRCKHCNILVCSLCHKEFHGESCHDR